MNDESGESKWINKSIGWTIWWNGFDKNRYEWNDPNCILNDMCDEYKVNMNNSWLNYRGLCVSY